MIVCYIGVLPTLSHHLNLERNPFIAQAAGGPWASAAAASRPLTGSAAGSTDPSSAAPSGISTAYTLPETLPTSVDVRQQLLQGYAACWLGLVSEAPADGAVRQAIHGPQAMSLEADGEALLPCLASLWPDACRLVAAALELTHYQAFDIKSCPLSVMLLVVIICIAYHA